MRRSLETLGLTLLGVASLTTEGRSQEAESSPERARPAIEALNLYELLKRQSIQYQEFSGHHPESIALIQQFWKLRAEVDQTNDPDRIEQAVQEFAGSARVILGSKEHQELPARSALEQHAYLVEEEIVPYLASHGYALDVTVHYAAKRISRDHYDVESVVGIPKSVRTVEAVSAATVSNFLGKANAFPYQAVVMGVPATDQDGEPLIPLTETAPPGATSYDTVFLDGKEFNRQSYADWMSEFQSTTRPRAQEMAQSSLQRHREVLQRGIETGAPEQQIRQLAAEVSLIRLYTDGMSEYKEQGKPVSDALQQATVSRLHTHEAGHVYFERQPWFQTMVPFDGQALSREELAGQLLQYKIKKEIGAMLVELRTEVDKRLQLAGLISRAGGEPRGQHDLAARWILQEMVNRITPSASAYGLELDPDLPLWHQVVIQANLIAEQPDAINRMADELIQVYQASIEQDFVTELGEPIQRSEAAQLEDDKERVSQRVGLGMIGAALAGTVGLAAWRQRRMREKRQQEAEAAKRRKGKKRP